MKTKLLTAMIVCALLISLTGCAADKNRIDAHSERGRHNGYGNRHRIWREKPKP